MLGERALEEQICESQPLCTETRLVNERPVLLPKGKNRESGRRRFLGRFRNTPNEKPQPAIPVTVFPGRRQAIVVLGAMSLEKEFGRAGVDEARAGARGETFTRRRPTRPLPSRNGWIVSNCAWARPTVTRTGRSSPSWRNSSKLWSASRIAGTGGGTNVACEIGAPSGPTQFCVERNSPGLRLAPRPPCSSSAWISRIKRSERGGHRVDRGRSSSRGRS